MCHVKSPISHLCGATDTPKFFHRTPEWIAHRIHQLSWKHIWIYPLTITLDASRARKVQFPANRSALSLSASAYPGKYLLAQPQEVYEVVSSLFYLPAIGDQSARMSILLYLSVGALTVVSTSVSQQLKLDWWKDVNVDHKVAEWQGGNGPCETSSARIRTAATIHQSWTCLTWRIICQIFI